MASKHPITRADANEFDKTQQRYVDRYVDMLWVENPEKVGPGNEWETKAELKAALLALNPHENWLNKECDKTIARGQLIPGHHLWVPKGLDFHEVAKEANCAIPRPSQVRNHRVTNNPPVPVASVPPQTPPEATLQVSNPVEFSRQSTPSSDGPKWRPGTQSHALELLARSGVDPAFSKWYFALDQVAARHAVTTAATSGQLAGKVNGNETGDFQHEGRYFGENPESTQDNKSEKGRRATTGNGGFIGQAVTGPRNRGFVTGHIAGIEADGTMDRAKSMPIEFAHAYKDRTTGAKTEYAFSLFGVIVPTGDMLGLPVGAIKSSPQKQTVLPADTKRWGIDQAVHVMNRLNEGGWKGFLRDEQAKITSPFETPDRVYAKMFGDNAANVFAASMKAAEAATDPVARNEAAKQALIAWRDMGNNAMVRRVDSLQIPMDEARKGIEAHLTSLGVDVAALKPVVAKAPLLEVRDMPQSLKDELQDSKALADSRYANINPGQTNPAYASAVRYGYRTMNAFDQDVALVRAKEMKEEQIIGASRDVWQAANNPASAAAIGSIMTTNRQVAGKIGFLLHDVDRNYQNYGFKSHSEARAFTDKFVGDDKAVRDQIYKQGRTTPTPILGVDESYAVTNPELIGTAIGAKIQANPALFSELMDRATDPALGRDSKGRSDGRRYGFGLLRELGAQMLAPGAKEGDLPPDYQKFAATLPAAAQAHLRSTVLAAVSYGESGASGVRSNAVQGLDNLYKAAQLGQRNGTAVVSDATTAEQRAALTKGKTGLIDTLNTGGVDGAGVFEASRRGDADGVLSGLALSAEAREAGRDQVIVRGLTAHPALARDAILATMLREPNALNGVIKELRNRDHTMRGDRYGALANALEETREDALRFQKTGNEKDRTAAVQQFGKFFSQMAHKEGKNSSAQRFDAWNGLVEITANNPSASAWVVDTVAKDAGLRDGLLASVPDAVKTLDGARPNHSAGVKGKKFGVDLSGDDVYVSRFFTLPTDAKGRATGGRVSVNAGELAAALGQHTTPAAPPSSTTPAVGATLSGKLNAADTESLKAALSGATIEGRTSALRGWIAEHQAGAPGTHNGLVINGELSASQRDALLTAAGKGDTADARLAGFTAALTGVPTGGTKPATPATATTAVGATLSGKLNAADTESLKAALSGATIEGRTSALRGWIAEHQAGAPGTHSGLVINGELSASQRDALLTAAGKGDTADARLAGFTAALTGVPTGGTKPATPATATPADASIGGITKSLVAAGVTPPTALGHALNTNPVIVLGSNPNQSPVEGLAGWLAGHKAELAAGQTYPQLAASILDAGLVKVASEPGKLAVTPNSEALNATLAAGSQLTGGAGFLSKSLLLLLIGGGSMKDLPFNPGTVPNCGIPGVTPRVGAFCGGGVPGIG